MKQLIIITYPVFNFEEHRFSIGGVQTYIQDLLKLGIELHYKAIVCQVSTKPSNIQYYEYSNYQIEEVVVSKRITSNYYQRAFDIIFKKYNNQETIFIIISENLGIKSKADNVVAIQHGIAFDIPKQFLRKPWNQNLFLSRLWKITRSILAAKRFTQTKNTVCVDYNYVNWLRTIDTIPNNHRVQVVLNYSSGIITQEELENKLSTLSSKKKIVFARRFTDYRGVLIFTNAIEKLFNTRDDIEVTFAGQGPLLNYIENKFKGNNNVIITSYSPNDSITFHKQFDIAVVPTIYSEGSSLSLCEAMSSGCFPISSLVGGMSNMIINNYNGCLFYPTEDDLIHTLNNVLDMPSDEFNRIVRNAYNTAGFSFSIERWKSEWKLFLQRIN